MIVSPAQPALVNSVFDTDRVSVLYKLPVLAETGAHNNMQFLKTTSKRLWVLRHPQRSLRINVTIMTLLYNHPLFVFITVQHKLSVNLSDGSCVSNGRTLQN